MRSDPGLRGLAAALDPVLMLPVVAAAVGLDPGDAGHLRCEARVVTLKPGRRCVIRYALTSSAPEGAPLWTVFGKVYVSRRRAALMRDQHEALCGSGVPSLPACLGLVEEAHLVLQEGVAGTSLDRRLDGPEAHPGLVRAARWLASLHGTPPLPGLKRIPLERSLEKAGLWCHEVGRALDAADARVQEVLGALAARALELPPRPTSMIHRDFQPAHVLEDGDRLWVLDFDELCLGDPALDVGHFLAQLAFALRTRLRRRHLATVEARFVESYREAAPANLRDALPFYRAYTFLKLADQHARRRPAGWRRSCNDLLELARAALRGS